MTTCATTRAPLLVTGDHRLSAEVQRLAAAAGVAVDVVSHPQAAMRAWATASTVLLGADRAEAASLLAPPRRRDLHLLGTGAIPDSVFRCAVDIGASSVRELPAAGPWLLEALTDLGDDGTDPAIVVGVVGASGGVGASVFAAALATAASAAAETLLIDLDPLGAGQRTLVGFDDVPGITWQELRDSAGRLGSRALREAVPSRDGLGVLAWPVDTSDPMPVGTVREVVSAARRGHGWLVLDLPRRLDDETLSVASTCDHVAVLASSRLASLASAVRFSQTVREALPRCGLVLRTARDAPAAPELARALGLDLWVEMRDDRRLDEHLALGLGPLRTRRSPLARAANAVLARCADRRAGGAS